MRIIFSRKGFDSTAGGFASPIFPDGTLFSIPIPSSCDDLSYSNLSFEYENDSIQSIINDITGCKIKHNKRLIPCNYSNNEQRCHHDPMVIPNLQRLALGQANNAESHLRKQGVDVGDIFLFYGWFRQIEKLEGRWQYSPRSPDIHLIWSWMEIGEKLDARSNKSRDDAIFNCPSLKAHPHLTSSLGQAYLPVNSVYVSEKSALLKNLKSRCLTDCANYRGRSTWRLPAYFNQPQAFSFLKNFTADGDEVIITFKGYGQEFVLDLDKVSSESDRSNIITYLDKHIFLSTE
jgi:hypothetical protein